MKRPSTQAKKRERSSIARYIEGTTTRLSTVETMIPPITAIAIGARKAPPSPTPSAEGSMPADMAMEVITMGWARLWPASTTASIRLMPRSRISMAKSIKRIAFFATIPISIRMPISTGMESGFCVTISAVATPPTERSSEKMMVIGCRTEWKSRMSTNIIRRTPRTIAFLKLPRSSACTSASPEGATLTEAGRFSVGRISLKRAVT